MGWFLPINPKEWHEYVALYRPLTTMEGEKVRFESMMRRLRDDGQWEYRRKTDAEHYRDSAW